MTPKVLGLFLTSYLLTLTSYPHFLPSLLTLTSYPKALGLFLTSYLGSCDQRIAKLCSFELT